MSEFDQQWKRLVDLARLAPPAADAVSPSGFATRVVARAATRKSAGNPWAVLERLALRGVLAATACCLAAVVFNYLGTTPEISIDSDLDETVITMLDLS